MWNTVPFLRADVRDSSSNQNYLTINSLWLSVRYGTLLGRLYDDSQDEQKLSAKAAIERLSRCPAALLPKGKGTFRKKSAETSINSYCQGQAAMKKNIICPNERLVIIGTKFGYQQPHLKGTMADLSSALTTAAIWPSSRTKRLLQVVNLLSYGSK